MEATGTLTAGADGCAAAAVVGGWAEALAGMTEVPTDASEADLVDLIRRLEDVKAGAAALQARSSVALDGAVRARHSAAGLPGREQGRGVSAQVALARRESPVRGGQHLGLAKALVREMPHTLAALTQGRLSEWRATLLCRETACLSAEHRGVVDRELCADPERLEGWGDRRVEAEAKKLAYRLDPQAAVRRTRKAEADRRVTVRPAPDTMAYLSALLPVAQGVACFAALDRAARAATAAGDGRTRGQLMADLVVERLTGQSAASDVPVEVDLVISDRTLLGQGTAAGDEPAHVPGYGPVPGQWAREFIQGVLAGDLAVSLRRLYARPDGRLVGMESTRRTFPQGLARYIKLRDGGTCRSPYCDAPVRHIDHVQPFSEGGETSADNGQGLCAACNYTKESPGWSARTEPASAAEEKAHTVLLSTPSGHVYRSQAPPILGPPGTGPPRADLMWVDLTGRAA